MSAAAEPVAAKAGAGRVAAGRGRPDLTGPLLATPVTLWLLAAFAAPFAVVGLLSLHDHADPFGPLLQAPSTAQFRTIFSDAFYLKVIAETLLLGAGVTALTALLGYPLALWLVRLPARWRPLGFAVILIPLLTNVVVRSLGIVLLLAPDGLINQALGLFGIPPFRQMLFSHGAVMVALAQVFMPFMVLALYDVLQAASPRIREAAESLGASGAARVWLVELPLSLPGLRAGVVIVFLLASTAYVSATLLGGKKVWTTGMLVWQEALQNLNAPLAAALALVMTVAGVAVTLLVHAVIGWLTPWRRPGGETRGVDASAAASRSWRSWSTPSWSLPFWALRLIEVAGPALGRLLLAAALLLLLLPLALVAVQSVNDVPQATVAGFRAFTWRWYERALFGGAYAPSFWVSLQLALATGVVAVLLALPAALALARHRFRGLGALSAFWMLSLSLPHVAIGVGMLKLLQAFTVLPAFAGLLAVHVVLALPFAISLLHASAEQLDRAQEDAAASLGASPWARFRHVILPGLAPGVAATGLMSFLISFGEVTVTSFLTTARMTTLPVRIYAEASFSLEPTAHAVSTLLIVATVLLLVILNRFVRLDRLYAR